MTHFASPENPVILYWLHYTGRSGNSIYGLHAVQAHFGRASVHIFVLGRHLGFGNCEGWGEEIFRKLYLLSSVPLQNNTRTACY